MAKHTATKIAPGKVETTDKACACGSYEASIYTIDESTGATDFSYHEETSCNSATTRAFAPGHDAKLKGLLIRAGVAGASVTQAAGGVSIITDPIKVAREFGFESQVVAGIKRGKSKLVAKQAKLKAKEAAKEARVVNKAKTSPATKAPRRQVRVTSARIKVGRWTYEAQIDKQGNATYTTPKGGQKIALAGAYNMA